MKLKIQTARQRLLASTIIGGAALLALQAAPAYAQDDATEVEGVVVTGSRIVRQDFEAISPVTTVGSEQLELTGLMRPFDLEVWFGERVAVLGSNGSGKSHFLRLLAAGGTDPDVEQRPVEERPIEPVRHRGIARLGARVRPGW